MLKIIVSVLLSLFASSVCSADFWTEIQTNKTRGTEVNQINFGGTGEHWFAFGQSVEGGYSQVYGGPRFNPTSWSEVGVAAGAETVGNGWNRRFGSYAWAGKDKWSVLFVNEDGPMTGQWHKDIIKYQATPSLAIGLQTQKFLGNGPRVEYQVNKTVSLWGVVLNKHGVTTTTAAIKFQF